MAPLVWVPWVPGNPQNFELWFLEPTNFENQKYILLIFPKFIVFVEVANEFADLLDKRKVGSAHNRLMQ